MVGSVTVVALLPSKATSHVESVISPKNSIVLPALEAFEKANADINARATVIFFFILINFSKFYFHFKPPNERSHCNRKYNDMSLK